MIWGVDIGLGGAMALITENEDAKVFDMPVVEIGRRKEVSANGVREILMEHRCPVLIERVNAMPNQGPASMFSFGTSWGITRGVVAGIQYPVSYVHPKVWKQALQLQKGKDASRSRAMDLYPKLHDVLKRKKDDGRAEALLIAHYGINHLESFHFKMT